MRKSSIIHLTLFSVRNIPIFAVVSAPGIGLAMRDGSNSRTPAGSGWRGRLAAGLSEFGGGLRLIAQNQNRRRWHVTPSLTVLALSLRLSHPGRLKFLVSDFDRDRFPVDAATFLAHNERLPTARLYSSWRCGGYLIYRLEPSSKVNRWSSPDILIIMSMRLSEGT